MPHRLVSFTVPVLGRVRGHVDGEGRQWFLMWDVCHGLMFWPPWDKLAPLLNDELRTVEIKGEHFQMFTPAGVARLAELRIADLRLLADWAWADPRPEPAGPPAMEEAS